MTCKPTNQPTLFFCFNIYFLLLLCIFHSSLRLPQNSSIYFIITSFYYLAFVPSYSCCLFSSRSFLQTLFACAALYLFRNCLIAPKCASPTVMFSAKKRKERQLCRSGSFGVYEKHRWRNKGLKPFQKAYQRNLEEWKNWKRWRKKKNPIMEGSDLKREVDVD